MVMAFRSLLLSGGIAIALSQAACAQSNEPAASQALEPAAPVVQTQQSFESFLEGVRAEAISNGIRPEIVQAALRNVDHIDKIIELDRKQPEFTLTFPQYLDRVVNKARIEKGRRLYAENRVLLEEVGRRYGVQPKYVVALWGIETDFGRVTGGYSVVSALSTLAYDGRRSAYFRTELMDALKVLDGGHTTPQAMLGSWAGAMGQCQFMPSSFLKFAEDFNGDGRRDIWGTRADVFASAANYLSQSGWKGDETWGRSIKLPANFDQSWVGLDKSKTVNEWAKLGITRADGSPLPKTDIQASLVKPDGVAQGFLVYDNFKVVMKWNRSTYFALSVGHLADAIGGR